MIFGQPSSPVRARVIGPSRGFGWSGLLLVVGFGAMPPWAEWSMLGLPPVVAKPVFTLCLALGLWKFDFAPRLAWNAYGLAVRSSWRVTRVRWPEVGALTIVESGLSGARIMVHLADGRFEVGLDRLWWLARLSPRYANRNRQYLEELRQTRQRAQDLGEVGEPPVLRNVIPLLGALACWVLGLSIAVYLY